MLNPAVSAVSARHVDVSGHACPSNLRLNHG